MEEKMDQKTQDEKMVSLYKALIECPDCSRRMDLRVIFIDSNLFHCPTCGSLKKTAMRFGFWGEWEGAKKILGIEEKK